MVSSSWVFTHLEKTSYYPPQFSFVCRLPLNRSLHLCKWCEDNVSSSGVRIKKRRRAGYRSTAGDRCAFCCSRGVAAAAPILLCCGRRRSIHHQDVCSSGILRRRVTHETAARRAAAAAKAARATRPPPLLQSILRGMEQALSPGCSKAPAHAAAGDAFQRGGGGRTLRSSLQAAGCSPGLMMNNRRRRIRQRPRRRRSPAGLL